MDASDYRLEKIHEARAHASFRTVSTAVVNLIEATVQKRSVTQAKKGLEKALENLATSLLEALFTPFEPLAERGCKISNELEEWESFNGTSIIPDEDSDFSEEELAVLNSLSDNQLKD